MTTRFDLAGKTVVLTGAAGLLGQEFADVLVSSGANVLLTDQSETACAALARSLSQKYPEARVATHSGDITKPSDVSALRDRVLERFGGVHALVNNAAIDDRFTNAESALALSRFENYPLAQWQRMLDVNVTGAMLCCQALGSWMAEAGRGSIVNIASTYALVAPQQDLYRTPEGHQSFFKGVAYPTTKAAVIGLTRYLASYWGPCGVRVNALCPGGVENGQPDHFIAEYSKRTPLRRMAKATDYRDALAFLLSDASSYMTGAQLVIDGGWTVW